jgi:hypothetical protein
MLCEVNEDGTNEWELTNFDVETTIPPTWQREVERLHVLQSYNILDLTRKKNFRTSRKKQKNCLRYQSLS